jgi:hypothetical protein
MMLSPLPETCAPSHSTSDFDLVFMRVEQVFQFPDKRDNPLTM